MSVVFIIDMDTDLKIESGFLVTILVDIPSKLLFLPDDPGLPELANGELEFPDETLFVLFYSR